MKQPGQNAAGTLHQKIRFVVESFPYFLRNWVVFVNAVFDNRAIEIPPEFAPLSAGSQEHSGRNRYNNCRYRDRHMFDSEMLVRF